MLSRSPLQGFNHNIRYRNRIYHVQTEDSGLDNPLLFTHLFHGGVIIATARSTYEMLRDEPDRDTRVKKMMQEQHKKLMKQLRRGNFDGKIELMLGSIDPDDQTQSQTTPAESAQKDIPATPATAAPSVDDRHSAERAAAKPAKAATERKKGSQPADKQRVPPAPAVANTAQKDAAQVSAKTKPDDRPKRGKKHTGSSSKRPTDLREQPVQVSPGVFFASNTKASRDALPLNDSATPAASMRGSGRPVSSPPIGTRPSAETDTSSAKRRGKSGARPSQVMPRARLVAKPLKSRDPIRQPSTLMRYTAPSKTRSGILLSQGHRRMAVATTEYTPEGRAEPIVLTTRKKSSTPATGLDSGSYEIGSRGAIPLKRAAAPAAPKDAGQAVIVDRPGSHAATDAHGMDERPSRKTPVAQPRRRPNLFGSDLLSERSLDEVILQYLAEDGESTPDEK